MATKRKSTLIKTDTFKAFLARTQWKKSLKKVIAINRLAVLGKRGDACKDLFPEGDSCSDASDSETEAPDHSPEKRTAPTNSKLLEDKTNAVLQLNDGEQLESSSIDSTPKNFSDSCSEK